MGRRNAVASSLDGAPVLTEVQQIALKLLQEGVNVDVIVSTTGVSEAEIQGLASL